MKPNRIERIELKPTDLILKEAHRSRVYPRSAHQERKSATADLRCAVSKDGRWHDLASGRPSRRAFGAPSGRGFETRASALLRMMLWVKLHPPDPIGFMESIYELQNSDVKWHVAQVVTWTTLIFLPWPK
jgi:hypothetical protein